MSVTQSTSDPAEMLIRWLCAECYGKYLIAGFKGGVASETTSDMSRSTTINVSFGNVSVDLLKRNFTKSTRYYQHFLNPNGYAVDGPIDTQYQSYFDSDCWGAVVSEHEGSYAESNDWENSQIYFADLRSDILVYYHESGSYTASGTGSEPIGPVLASAEFEGTPGCKNVVTNDAVKMEITVTKPESLWEFITIGNHTPFQSESAGTTATLNISASDYSGYAGGVAFGAYQWGTYSVVDENKPYNCIEGSLTELINPENIEGYYNSWDSFGRYSVLDEFDAGVWSGTMAGNTIPGEYDYPSFIDIDPMPRGSWCTDASGNIFFSQITRDMGVFNKLNTLDPKTIAALSETGVVFYPVAPA